MKYDLEELLSKYYEQSEKASHEFSRSVIERMKASSGRLPRKKPWICVAACIGVLLLSGTALLSWKVYSDTREGKRSAQWSKSEVEGKATQVPDDVGGQSGIAGQPEEASNGGAGVQENLSGDGNDGKGQQGLSAPTGLPKVPDDSSDVSSRNPPNNHSQKERRQSENVSEKSVKIHPKPDAREQSASSENQEQKPSANPEKKPGIEGKPGDMKKPAATGRPEATGKPAATGNPAGSSKPLSVKDYTKLCSMQCVCPEGEDAEKVALAFSSLIDEGVLQDQLITSYDQLQDVIQKIQKEHSYWYIIKELVEPLEKYDRAYFQNKVLYYHNIYWTMGYDFKLSSVALMKEEGGKKYLNIELEPFWALPPDLCAPSVMCYYGCFIQMPKNAAEECDAMKCSLTMRKE